jgi:hypothetical protein
MMSLPQAITVSNLDHLGLVAGMIDEIGIVEKINDLVGSQPGEKVSPGHAVKAMIINGLGLVSSPLYIKGDKILILTHQRPQIIS